ncbi:MAG: hypothetical protein P4L16_07085 [Chlamydiales bacterium]|nr:hypothetical protein [Chlamydiales bacterium]
MQKGPHLTFNCVVCSHPVVFSVWSEEEFPYFLSCCSCEKKYGFSQEITRQLKKFEALCLQIHHSEEILGNTQVAIDVGPHHIKVPYRLLLTRLSSVMDLTIGDKKIEIAFRTEPLNDCK